jgi:YfiH family protein
VRIVRNGDDLGRAAEQRPDGDAIVSNVAGLALAVMVADCVPILIAEPARGVAAAVHAGWRGTCARVAPTAIEVMCRELGADPAGMIAAVGPSVGPDDYEVGEQLIEAFVQSGHARADVDRWFIRSRPRPHLDLWSANRDQLIAAGLSRDHIHCCGLSTVAHPDVFDSYRVAGERAGRMAGIVIVPA